MSFGIHSTQEAFHELLGDLLSIETDIDDILVQGQDQHDQRQGSMRLQPET